MTTADMVKVGRQIMEGKGLCLTCHTVGKTGALRFPDLAGHRRPREDPRHGPERRRVPRPVAVRTDGLRGAGIPSGDAADEPAAVRPHRSGDSLRDRGPPDVWRHADGHAPDDAQVLRRRGRTRRGAGAAGGAPDATARPARLLAAPTQAGGGHDEHPGRPRRGRRVRAPSLPPGQPADVGRRLVGGDLRPAPLRIHRADSRPPSSRSTWASSRSRSWPT